MCARRLHDRGWTTPVASGLALAGFLLLALVAFTILAAGPLEAYDVYLNLHPAPSTWAPVLQAVDRIGQRAVALPVLAVVVLWLWRGTGSSRPATTAVLSVVALNLLVGGLKLVLGRGHPETGDPSFFSGGTAYPSGHAANVVLVYGLAVLLVSRHLRPPRRAVVVMSSTVGVLAVALVAASLALGWHWMSDLVAGLLVGGVVLVLTETADRVLGPGPGSGLTARRSPGPGRSGRGRRSGRPPRAED